MIEIQCPGSNTMVALVWWSSGLFFSCYWRDQQCDCRWSIWPMWTTTSGRAATAVGNFWADRVTCCQYNGLVSVEFKAADWSQPSLPSTFVDEGWRRPLAQPSRRANCTTSLYICRLIPPVAFGGSTDKSPCVVGEAWHVTSSSGVAATHPHPWHQLKPSASALETGLVSNPLSSGGKKLLNPVMRPRDEWPVISLFLSHSHFFCYYLFLRPPSGRNAVKNGSLVGWFTAVACRTEPTFASKRVLIPANHVCLSSTVLCCWQTARLPKVNNWTNLTRSHFCKTLKTRNLEEYRFQLQMSSWDKVQIMMCVVWVWRAETKDSVRCRDNEAAQQNKAEGRKRQREVSVDQPTDCPSVVCLVECRTCNRRWLKLSPESNSGWTVSGLALHRHISWSATRKSAEWAKALTVSFTNAETVKRVRSSPSRNSSSPKTTRSSRKSHSEKYACWR